MSTLEMIRFVKECFPEYGGQLYMGIVDAGKLFGMSDDQMRAFINERGIPYYRPVKRKMYNVIEVFEEIQKTRNSAGGVDS